jgi:hypothetical protein
MDVLLKAGDIPSSEEGAGVPIKQMPRYLSLGTTGEVRQLFDLPRCAAG